MEDFPRIPMRSRIKVYNKEKAEFSVGTVMSRQGVDTYEIRFNGVDRIVSLRDMSTWKFVQTPMHQRRQDLASQSSQQNISTKVVVKPVQLARISQHTAAREPLDSTRFGNRVQPSTPPSVTEPVREPYLRTHHAQANIQVPLPPESEIQRNPEAQENKQEVPPGENSPPPNLDLSPQPVTENHQSRRASARHARKAKRSREAADLRKQKRVKFGKSSIFYFDPKADGNGKDTSRGSKLAAGSEISRHRKKAPNRDARLRPSSEKKSHAKPAEANARKLSSNIDDHEGDCQSLGTERHPNRVPNAESTSFSATAEHEVNESPSKSVESRKTALKKVISAPAINEDKDEHTRHILRRSERLKKSREIRHLPCTLRLRPRDSVGGVAKASNLVENKRLFSLERTIQRENHNITEDPECVSKASIICDKTHSEEMICEPEELSRQSEGQELLETKHSLPLKAIKAETIRGELASAIEDIAARKTGEVIDHLSKEPDLLLHFPDFDFSEMRNSLHREHISIMNELISEKMVTDAAKFANTFSSSKEEFTEAATLFAELQLEKAAKLLNDIHISEIDFAIRRKRDESYGDATSSAEIDRTIRGKRNNSDLRTGPLSVGTQATKK